MIIRSDIRNIFIGVHIGHPSEFSSIAIIGRVLLATGGTKYHCLEVVRIPAMSEFLRIVELVAGVMNTPLASSRNPVCIVSLGDVGAPILKMIRKVLIMGGRVVGIRLGGGVTAAAEGPDKILTVGQAEVTTSFLNLVQAGRLKVEIAEKEQEEFRRQLDGLSFAVRKRKEQKLDEELAEEVAQDMTIALAVACWYGEVKRPTVIRRKPDVQPAHDPWS